MVKIHLHNASLLFLAFFSTPKEKPIAYWGGGGGRRPRKRKEERKVRKRIITRNIKGWLPTKDSHDLKKL
jgi:hypothetical protein